MAAGRDVIGNIRELLMLALGAGLVLVGLASKPRDPATISIGVSLLVGTSVVSGSKKKDEDESN